MNVHPEPTESEVQEAYFQTLAKLDPSAEMARVIERAKADLARRAVVPEPEEVTDEQVRVALNTFWTAVEPHDPVVDPADFPAMRAALEAAAVVPVQTPPTSTCGDHRPVQHRDGKPPWCKSCGLTASFAVPHSRFEGSTAVMQVLGEGCSHCGCFGYHALGCPTTRIPLAASPVPSREAIAAVLRDRRIWYSNATDLEDADAVLALWVTPTEPGSHTPRGDDEGRSE